jgi:putative PIN family toxin of toxin-antitoxin system
MKVVLDTNVFIAAFTARGLAHLVFEHCLEEHDVFISEAILAECENGLRRVFKMPADLVSAYRALLETACIREDIAPVESSSCRDPNDLHILGLAVKAGADIIITGDGDLLDLGSFRGIPILSPRRFWEKERAFVNKIQSPRARYGKQPSMPTAG